MNRTTKNYAWVVVGVLWVVSMLNYLDRLLIASMRGPIKESIPMTDAEFGLLTSAFLIIYAILSPLGGYLADRFGSKNVEPQNLPKEVAGLSCLDSREMTGNRIRSQPILTFHSKIHKSFR